MYGMEDYYKSKKYKGFREYNEKTKLNILDLKEITIRKNYELITTEYVNSRTDLEFICNKHSNIGVQKTNASRLQRIDHNCIECQKRDNQKERVNKILRFSPLEWYKKILNKEEKIFPHGFFNYYSLNDLKEIVIYYEKVVNENENIFGSKVFSYELMKKYKLNVLVNIYSIYGIYDSIYPNKLKIWEMNACPPKYWNDKNNIKEACNWFYNKLYEDSIIFNDEDILEIKNYGKLFKKYKLDGMFTRFFNSSHFKFWNNLFPNRWFEWEYKITPKHYWESKYNRINALKELIEYKLEIQLNELPEKISYPFLVKNYRKFSAICDIHYHSDFYLWINDCYPNLFRKEEFHNNMAKDGTVLDSKHEVLIHNLFLDNHLDLKYFENKQIAMKQFYNDKVNENYVPDWIINDNLIVEYFGWHNEKQYGKNKTITNYMNKAKRKVEYFSKINNINFIDLYPRDLENNLSGIINKFNSIGIELKVVQ